VEIMAATNRWVFMVANGQASETATHALTANGTTYAWTGNYSLRKM
jgi:hypothetical protein